MITRTEIINRVSALANGEGEVFSGSEIGRPQQSIFVHKNERGGLYTMSQCGDWLGDDNNKNDVIDLVWKQVKG